METIMNTRCRGYPKSLEELQANYYNISNESNEFLHELFDKYIFVYVAFEKKVKCVRFIGYSGDNITYQINHQNYKKNIKYGLECTSFNRYTLNGCFFINNEIALAIKEQILLKNLENNFDKLFFK